MKLADFYMFSISDFRRKIVPLLKTPTKNFHMRQVEWRLQKSRAASIAESILGWLLPQIFIDMCVLLYPLLNIRNGLFLDANASTTVKPGPRGVIYAIIPADI